MFLHVSRCFALFLVCVYLLYVSSPPSFLFISVCASSLVFISPYFCACFYSNNCFFSETDQKKATHKKWNCRSDTTFPSNYPTFTPTKDHTELPVPEDITFLYIKKKYLIAGVCKNCYDKLLQVYPKELLWFSINLFFWNLPHKCNWYKTQLPHPPSNHPTYTPKKGMVFNMVK